MANTYPLSRSSLDALVGDLAVAAEEAALALVRLDERLGLVDRQLADGVCSRMHILEAQALAGLGGELVGLEDLVLHDERLDARAPGAGVVRASRILRERRLLAGRPPEAALAAQAVRRLIGTHADALGPAQAAGAPGRIDDGAGLRLSHPSVGGSTAMRGQATAEGRVAGPRPWRMPLPGGADHARDAGDEDADTEEAWEIGSTAGDRSAGLDLAAIDRLIARTRRPLAVLPREDGAPEIALRDPGYGSPARLDLWLLCVEMSRSVPGALAAALALDAWLLLEPSERAGEAGWALAATVLRERGLCRRHLPALGRAYRKGRFRWSPHLTLGRRLEGLLAAVAGSARLAGSDLKRLTLAREVMMRRCEGRRAGSRLPELVGLFLELPLVTTRLAARRLKVSPQAVEAMLKELGPSLPREITGRKRYRAWGVL